MKWLEDHLFEVVITLVILAFAVDGCRKSTNLDKVSDVDMWFGMAIIPITIVAFLILYAHHKRTLKKLREENEQQDEDRDF